MANQVQEFKVVENKKWQPILTLLGLFLPMPMLDAKYTPDYVVNGWGLGYSIALTDWKIPLGWIMIIVSLIF